MVASYQVTEVVGSKVAGEIVDTLDELAREGARKMLHRALEAEVAEYLGRERYERVEAFCGNRNGHARERTLGVGTWGVPVPPRVSDVPEGMRAFESKIWGGALRPRALHASGPEI